MDSESTASFYDDLFTENITYISKQLYHAERRIRLEGYQYVGPNGQTLVDLDNRWDTLHGPGVYQAYMNAPIQMHTRWVDDRKGDVLQSEEDRNFVRSEYRMFIQNSATQCLASILDKNYDILRVLTLPAKEQLVPTSPPLDSEETKTLIFGILYQKVKDNRPFPVILQGGRRALWDNLGADVIHDILSRAESAIKQNWEGNIFVGQYDDVYSMVGTILRGSMKFVLDKRITQGRQDDDLFGISVKTTPDTPPYSGSSPSSPGSSDSLGLRSSPRSTGSRSSGYDPTDGMDM